MHQNRRGKLDSVVPSESMFLCQLASALDQRLCDIDDKIIVPVVVKFLNDTSIVFQTQGVFPALARKSSSRLCIGNKRDRGNFSVLNKALNRTTLWFRHIKLYQSAGIDVENHRRSSMTICETCL